MIDIIVKIMAELLSTLALATKQISQGRFSTCALTYTLPTAESATEKFAKKLLGDSEIEAVLQRLDRLTQDEARMTVAQTLGVVHGLVGNMKVVMEGAKFLHDCSQIIIFLMVRYVRWQGVNGEYSTRFGYVSRAAEQDPPHLLWSVVALHQVLNEMNKMKRSLFSSRLSWLRPTGSCR